MLLSAFFVKQPEKLAIKLIIYLPAARYFIPGIKRVVRDTGRNSFQNIISDNRICLKSGSLQQHNTVVIKLTLLNAILNRILKLFLGTPGCVARALTKTAVRQI